MDLGIAGKVAAVGGASTGLGRAIAEALAREGARVAICARGADQLERTGCELQEASGGQVLAYPVDLATENGPLPAEKTIRPSRSTLRACSTTTIFGLRPI